MNTPRVVVVTGSNQGIGYGIVRRFLKDEASWIIYLTARTVERGEQAVTSLAKEEGMLRQPHLHQLDITDPDSVRALKEHLKAEHGGIDVLVNNAAIAFQDEDESSNLVKAEVTMKTNYFATRYMFDELLSILKDGARVVNMASMLGRSILKKLSPQLRAAFTKQPSLTSDEVDYYMGKFIADVRSGEWASQGWPDGSAYHISKLGVIALTFDQQKILDLDARQDLVVNSCCPGYVSTNMTAYKGRKTIDAGADTPFFLATLPAGTNVRGKFVCRRAPVSWR